MPIEIIVALAVGFAVGCVMGWAAGSGVQEERAKQEKREYFQKLMAGQREFIEMQSQILDRYAKLRLARMAKQQADLIAKTEVTNV